MDKAPLIIHEWSDQIIFKQIINGFAHHCQIYSKEQKPFRGEIVAKYMHA